MVDSGYSKYCAISVRPVFPALLRKVIEFGYCLQWQHALLQYFVAHLYHFRLTFKFTRLGALESHRNKIIGPENDAKMKLIASYAK